MTQRTRRQRRRGIGIGGKLAIAFGTVAVLVGIAVIGITTWVLDVAAKAPPLASCRPVDDRGNSTIYAADGTKLGVIASSEARSPVGIMRIPRTVQLATVAIEDKRFYEHAGIDIEGIFRAAVTDVEAGEAVEGGSTITQQLVRNLCIQHPEQTLERKIIEAELAEEYAGRHSPQEILGSYLNIASYGTIEGSTAVGVAAASKIYFSKPIWKVDLPQAARWRGATRSCGKCASWAGSRPAALGRRSPAGSAFTSPRATSSTASPTSSTTSRTS
jgi:penicillin-binding protein 1A